MVNNQRIKPHLWRSDPNLLVNQFSLMRFQFQVLYKHVLLNHHFDVLNAHCGFFSYQLWWICWWLDSRPPIFTRKDLAVLQLPGALWRFARLFAMKSKKLCIRMTRGLVAVL